MPKPALHTLIWSLEQDTYALYTQGNRDAHRLQGDDTSWFAWLATHTSFSFQGRHGHLSLLKEMRPRGGEGYWYAYRRLGKRTVKQYAGRTPDLTLARLEDVAQTLGARTSAIRKAQPIQAVQTLHIAPRETIDEARRKRALDPVPTSSSLSHVLLLTPKLRPPRLAAPLILRERLLVLLDASLERKLTLLLAPAGFGKTTLLAEWVKHRQQQVTWISLDSEENDPSRFLAYLIGALQHVHPGIGQGLLAQLSVGSQGSLLADVAVLLNELAALPDEVIIIFDNYQVIENQIIHSALTLALYHLPTHVHLIIASRNEPQCPLARLRASRQITELRTSAFRFTREEVEMLFTSVMQLELQPEELVILEQRTEGWIAGLQLAAFAMQGQKDLAHFVATFAGNNRYILAYLLEEVLEPQPENIQFFLLATSLLDSFNSALCYAVTGQADAERVLEYLERANLFCFLQDEQRGWYSYHQLFAGALRHHLERTHPELLPILHMRASQWFEAHGLLEEAIKHALAAHDDRRATALIEQTAPALIQYGKIKTVQSWLAALPDYIVRSNPRLCMSTAWIMFITSHIPAFPLWVEAAERALRVCQATLPPETVVVLQAEIIALQAIHAITSNDFTAAIATCHQALQDLPTENLHLRGLVSLILGIVSSRGINTSVGVQAISEASSTIQAADHTPLLFSYIIFVQAELCMTRGNPSQAEKLYQQILMPTPTQHAPSAFASSLAHVGLAFLFWDWNDVQTARQHLLQAWELGMQNQAANILITTAFLLALISQVQGEREATDLWLQQMETVCRTSGHVAFVAIVAASRARFCLADGRLDEALLWMHERHHFLEDSTSTCDIFEKLTLVRVLIELSQTNADRSSVQRALALLERLRVTAEETGRVRVLLEILVLQTLALQLEGDSVRALCTLRQAVSLAEPGKYVRLFVNEGNPMAKLLRHLLTQQRTQKTPGQTISLTFLSHLLKAFASPRTSFQLMSPAEDQPLLDPLSRREREVLYLMAVGRKNREIADELVVVTGTVKAHINTIYQKLGVSSRVQAVVRARTLGLL